MLCSPQLRLYPAGWVGTHLSSKFACLAGHRCIQKRDCRHRPGVPRYGGLRRRVSRAPASSLASEHGAAWPQSILPASSPCFTARQHSCSSLLPLSPSWPAPRFTKPIPCSPASPIYKMPTPLFSNHSLQCCAAGGSPSATSGCRLRRWQRTGGASGSAWGSTHRRWLQ